MVNTISMQDIRHLNLFGKVTRVSTRHCFNYNETIFFGVPKQLLSKAIGEKGKNVRKINETLGKKVKIIPIPRSVEDAKFFISKIVEPVEFKELEIKEDEIVLTAGGQSKAALLGRNKRRLAEMQKIVADFFKRDFRIV
jgi:NusA-like KH domain protein